MKPRALTQRGFSLVEIVMALGIVTICVLTLMGLLIVGVNSNKGTVNQSIAVNIAGAVAADLRATPVVTQSYKSSTLLYSPRFGFQLPPTTATTGTASGVQTVYVSDQGTPVTQAGKDLPAGTAAYRVSIWCPVQPTSGSSTLTLRTASPVYILITWPGEADPHVKNPSNNSLWPSSYAGSFQVVTYLDQN
jgi:uncharacterized protein (TIGR02598 family)